MRRMLVLGLTLMVGGCGSDGDDAPEAAAVADSSFTELQQRGASDRGMGVDQYASAH